MIPSGKTISYPLNICQIKFTILNLLKKLQYAFVGLLLIASHSAKAQQVTRFGDDVGTLDGIIKAYYQNTTVIKGQSPSYERDSLLHFPGALVGGVSVSKEGKTIMNTMTVKKFHELYDAEMKKTGYEEHEISRKVQRFGTIYHVWSTYETRHIPGGPLLGRGIDSIELCYDGIRFWILGWFYDDERKGNPMPDKYLSSKESN